MLLQSLVNYYEALARKGEIEKLGWNPVGISYGICLDKDGHIDSVISLKQKTVGGKKELPKQISLPMPVKNVKNRTSNFLYENSKYLFGNDSYVISDETVDAFNKCKTKHLDILKNCNSEASLSIKNFFNNPIENLEDTFLTLGCTQSMVDEIIQKRVRLLLMPLGKYPFDFEEICNAWDDYYANVLDEIPDDKKEVCLVTGKKSKIAILHPSINNLSGAHANGATVVSFNKNAFESYGKTKGYNAPVSEYAAFAYSSALNKLISDSEHMINDDEDTTVVCWTEDAESVYQDILCDALGVNETVSQSDLWSVIYNIAHGMTVNWENMPVNPDNNFYILGISPNSARLSVRFFVRNTFGKVMQNILLHEEQMKIIKPSSETKEHLTLWQIVSQTVNPKQKDKSCKPHLAGDVLNAILNGTNYPATLYYGVQSRISAERDIECEKNIKWGKAAVIKAYLMRNYKMKYKEDLTLTSNDNRIKVADLLGVLFSNLEEIQYAANPNINTTIKDRYFVSASSTPAMVFPLLIELAQDHLKNLSVPKKIRLSKQLTKTMSEINKLTESFPVRLKLEEKGVFQLGYYRQNQKRYTHKEDKNNG